MKNHLCYDTVIAGSGVSGLLMARTLLDNDYKGSILLIDSRSSESILEEGDDIPYYFNKRFNLDQMTFSVKTMKFHIWDNGSLHERASKDMSDRYSQKIVKQKCHTTIEHIHGEKEIFVPALPAVKGRRNYLLRVLYEYLQGKVEIRLCNRIASIEMDKKQLHMTTGEVICYENLVSTISFPVFSEIAHFEMGLQLSLEQIPFYSAILEFPVEQYRAIYIPDQSVRFNRFAFIGNRLFIESPDRFHLSGLKNCEHQLIRDLECTWILAAGQPVTYKQIKPGRLVGIDQALSGELQDALREYQIYTLGRFGTWTFKLTEDVWADAELIMKSIVQ